MPNYKYLCSNEDCNHCFEIYRSIKADILKECPECKRQSLNTVIHAVETLIKSEPKTLGMLAERNTESLGRQQREDMWQQQKEHKKIAKEKAREELAAKLPEGASLPNIQEGKTWYRPNSEKPIESLAKLDMNSAKNYIEKGKV